MLNLVFAHGKPRVVAALGHHIGVVFLDTVNAARKTAEVYFLLYIVHFHTVKALKWFKYGEEHNKVVNGKNILGKRFTNPEDFLNAVKDRLKENFGEFFTILYEKSSPIDFGKYHGVPIQFIPILFPESKFYLIRNY